MYKLYTNNCIEEFKTIQEAKNKMDLLGDGIIYNNRNLNPDKKGFEIIKVDALVEPIADYFKSEVFEYLLEDDLLDYEVDSDIMDRVEVASVEGRNGFIFDTPFEGQVVFIDKDCNYMEVVDIEEGIFSLLDSSEEVIMLDIEEEQRIIVPKIYALVRGINLGCVDMMHLGYLGDKTNLQGRKLGLMPTKKAKAILKAFEIVIKKVGNTNIYLECLLDDLAEQEVFLEINEDNLSKFTLYTDYGNCDIELTESETIYKLVD